MPQLSSTESNTAPTITPSLDIDPIILGDNSFFGVNHSSKSKGQEKAKFFEKDENIINVFKLAKQYGIGGVSLSAHERIPQILKLFKKDPDLKSSFNIYPNIPYLMKYVQKTTRDGLMGTVKSILQPSTGLFSSFFKGGLAYMQKDYSKMIETALQIELQAYKGTTMKVVFLHNGLVDLALGLEMPRIFQIFDQYIRKHTQALPGFVTLNLCKLVQSLNGWGIEHPIVMAPFNKSSFHMNPSQKDCEGILNQFSFTLIAMNIMSSGALSAEEAFEYLGQFPQIKHIIIGASSEPHIKQCCELSKKHLKL